MVTAFGATCVKVLYDQSVGSGQSEGVAEELLSSQQWATSFLPQNTDVCACAYCYRAHMGNDAKKFK